MSYRAWVVLLVAFSITSATDLGNPEAFSCFWIIAMREAGVLPDFGGTGFVLVALVDLVEMAEGVEMFNSDLTEWETSSGLANRVL